MPTDTSFQAFQDEVGEWAEKTFPHSTVLTCINHLWREVAELKDSADAAAITEWNGCDPEELADCFLLLLHIAHKIKANLLVEAVVKHGKNKKRTWGNPDAEGVSEHIKDTE